MWHFCLRCDHKSPILCGLPHIIQSCICANLTRLSAYLPSDTNTAWKQEQVFFELWGPEQAEPTLTFRQEVAFRSWIASGWQGKDIPANQTPGSTAITNSKSSSYSGWNDFSVYFQACFGLTWMWNNLGISENLFPSFHRRCPCLKAAG